MISRCWILSLYQPSDIGCRSKAGCLPLRAERLLINFSVAMVQKEFPIFRSRLPSWAGAFSLIIDYNTVVPSTQVLRKV